MTIGKKIILACSALVALTIILGIVSILNLGRIDTAVTSVLVDSLPGLASAGRMESIIQGQRAFALRHMLVEAPDQKSQADSLFADGMSRFQVELTA